MYTKIKIQKLSIQNNITLKLVLNRTTCIIHLNIIYNKY